MSRARDLADGTFSGEFAADSPTLVVDATNNRVGVGTASPAGPLEVESSSNRLLTLDADSTAGFTMLSLRRQGTEAWRYALESNGDLSIREDANLSGEVMRLDTSGNLLVGKAAFSSASEGAELRPTGQAILVADGTNPILMNRLTSDGDIAVFRKDNNTVGSIGNAGLGIGMSTAGGWSLFLGNNAVTSRSQDFSSPLDNAKDVGANNARWDDIYATNGTIQTSDRNEKQDIEALSDAEQRVAVAAKGLLRKYRWKDAVAEKGDAARIHFGIIAQDLQAAFEAEGLDAGRYGMFISSTWWEADRVIPAVEGKDAVLDDEGNVVEEAIEAQPERVVTDTFNTLEEAPEGAVQRTRLGVRYPELLAFIIAAL